MVKKPGGAISRRASLASRLSTRTARISPAGGVSSPNRLRSALLNGRCQAKPRSPTIQVRWPHFGATVTPGRLIAKASTSARVIERPRGSSFCAAVVHGHLAGLQTGGREELEAARGRQALE